jgi:hypothetical protein
MLIEKCVGDSLISCLPFVVSGIGMVDLFCRYMFPSDVIFYVYSS